MFPTSSIHSHLCKSIGNITDCYNPSKLTVMMWQVMLLYWFVPPGQWMICTVVFLPEIGTSTGDCVSTKLLYRNATNVVKPRTVMEISCSQLSIDQVGGNEKKQQHCVSICCTTLCWSCYQLEKANVNLLLMKLTMCPLVSSIEGRLSRTVVWGKELVLRTPFSTFWFSAHLQGPKTQVGWGAKPCFCHRGSATWIFASAVPVHTCYVKA